MIVEFICFHDQPLLIENKNVVAAMYVESPAVVTTRNGRHVQYSPKRVCRQGQERRPDIETQYFLAHSTRSAASSKAAAAGVPVESIMQAAQWSRESTFSKHYRRDHTVPLYVQDAVFQSG